MYRAQNYRAAAAARQALNTLIDRIDTRVTATPRL